jgi:hypothetical protein
MEPYEKQAKLRIANKYFSSNWEWQWFCSLNLGNRSHTEAEKYLKIWRRQQAKYNHIQIASFGVYNTIPQAHIHLLALGSNKQGNSLLLVNHKKSEDSWSKLTKHSAKIIPIWDDDAQKAILSYIYMKNMLGNISESIQINNKRILKEVRSELIQPYNKRLLDKAMVG